MNSGIPIDIWELQETKYRGDLEKAIQAQNFIGWNNMLKGRIAREWGDVQMLYYYENDIPPHISATWWAREFIRHLLYFSLATWQHRNTYLHRSEEKEQKIKDRMEAVEEMAQWYDRKHEFPTEDTMNFS